MLAFDPSRLTIHDANGVSDWLDTAAMTGAEVINLNLGAVSTLNGQVFAVIGLDTVIDNVTLGDGASTVTGNDTTTSSSPDTARPISQAARATTGSSRDTATMCSCSTIRRPAATSSPISLKG